MYWCVKYISIKNVKKQNKAYTIADKTVIPTRTVSSIMAYALPCLAQ